MSTREVIRTYEHVYVGYWPDLQRQDCLIIGVVAWVSFGGIGLQVAINSRVLARARWEEEPARTRLMQTPEEQADFLTAYLTDRLPWWKEMQPPETPMHEVVRTCPFGSYSPLGMVGGGTGFVYEDDTPETLELSGNATLATYVESLMARNVRLSAYQVEVLQVVEAYKRDKEARA